MRSILAAVALSLVVVSPAVAAPKKEAASYSVELKAVGPYKKGTEGVVELVLVPKGAHHVNIDYPAKFKLVDPPPAGLTYPKKIVKKDDGKFEEAKGTLKIPFVAANAGKAKIAGTFHFSVCSSSNCFMEKADLDIEVDVQ